ncbi:ABC transporter ATP-binding protein [Marivivens donghaensis]|uniref:ABC transporter ATP-binding protein n=1 Tax=Marivivens donghaensis TaxID=1699413 RepID=A0ABX0W2N1_9RHOB|nr:ABC transporter ATP-binding protein [Marivivens donghaensis]NIY73667.1 ABC transporter ATP-binding protein [Marivivens donghaensis]
MLDQQTILSPILRTYDLKAGYEGKTILNGVDLDVGQGEFVALIGPNGCGKSTLLKTMARILTPTSGVAELNGRAVHDTPTREIAKAMALLPQTPLTPDGLTVRELVAQGRFPHQTLWRQWTKADETAVHDAMEATDVLQFADRPVTALSGGQRQRCWIAMTLAQDTDVILLDEPTTYLDLKIQIDVMQLLSKIAAQGRTLVVVLHELNLAAAYADRVVMMRDGAIVHQGHPAECITAETLEDVFGLRARVMTDPDTGRPVCIPMTGPAA